MMTKDIIKVIEDMNEHLFDNNKVEQQDYRDSTHYLDVKWGQREILEKLLDQIKAEAA